MIEKINSHSLYADEVRIYDTKTSDTFNNSLKELMINANSQAVKNRVSFNDADKNNKTINELNDIFNKCLSIYIKELYEDSLLENFDVLQDWSVNISYNGKAVYSHTHNESFVVMTYYPQDTDNLEEHIFNKHYFEVRSGQLVMSNPQGKPLWDRYARGDKGLNLRISPKKGMLVIFSGYMPHFVVPSEKNPRYCMTSFVSLKSKYLKPITLNNEIK
jgi:hypothetical protein